MPQSGVSTNNTPDKITVSALSTWRHCRLVEFPRSCLALAFSLIKIWLLYSSRMRLVLSVTASFHNAHSACKLKLSAGVIGSTNLPSSVSLRFGPLPKARTSRCLLQAVTLDSSTSSTTSTQQLSPEDARLCHTPPAQLQFQVFFCLLPNLLT